MKTFFVPFAVLGFLFIGHTATAAFCGRDGFMHGWVGPAQIPCNYNSARHPADSISSPSARAETLTFESKGTACGSSWTDDVYGQAMAVMDETATAECEKAEIGLKAFRVSDVSGYTRFFNGGRTRCENVMANYECR